MATITSSTPLGDGMPGKKDATMDHIEELSSGRVSPDSLETRQPDTIDELIRLRAQQQGCDEPIIAYPHEGTRYTDYTPRELDDLVERAASFYTSILPQRTTSDDPVQVVAMLGNSDLSYLISFLAVSRLGHSLLLLSTRITAEAYTSLIATTKASMLLRHENFADAASETQAAVPSLRIESICHTDALPAATSLQPSTLDPERETHNISFIIHSSGSTGLPKPIFQTHRACLYSYSQSFNRVGYITLPLYHNHGISCLFRAICARKKIYIYNAHLPLASQHLLATLKEHTEVKIFYGVPYALKLLSETDEGTKLLKRLDIVMFGGSACPKPIGDRLVESGVNLVGHYGATEVGQLMTSFRNHPEDKLWDWLRVPDFLKPFLALEDRGGNLFELCVLDGWKSKVVSNRDDGSYATKDLFEPHPTLPDTWRYYARLDDTITLENGEKANPLLGEGVLRMSPHVAEAVVFGVAKPSLGAFVIPADSSKLSDSEVLDSIMPAVEELNRAMPAYGQLGRDMIRILPWDVDYRRTDKGTVIRAAFYRDFAEAIEKAYADEASGSLVLDRDGLLQHLRNELVGRLSEKQAAVLSNDTDLFSLGVDSLQAIQVRSFVLKTLKLDAEKLGRNFVFDFPTLNQMADEVLRLQTGQPVQEKKAVEERMQEMIEKYATFQQHTPVERKADGKHVVVTGATGSLGAHVVANLVAQSAVRKVYCLVRASSSKSALSRVRQSMRDRYLYHNLGSAAWSKIVALPSEFGKSNLGLEPAQYDEVAANITHVIHLAWSVNFNKGLESFEGDCIAGACNLMSLCLKAQRPQPAAFNFCSSVSAVVRSPEGPIPEALPPSLSCAQGMGYAQSKLVTEHLCDRAAQQTGMKTRVLRVGQIIGDTKNGVWNDTEAIPMIFQTAHTVGALPELDEEPLWLPVDTVASAFAEISFSGADSGVMNVVHHDPFHWTRDLLPMLRATTLGNERRNLDPITRQAVQAITNDWVQVPQREWIRRLRESNPDPEANPPIKLVDFFASKYDKESTGKSLVYATDRAQGHSLALQNAPAIGQNAGLFRKILTQLSKAWQTSTPASHLDTAGAGRRVPDDPKRRPRTVIVLASEQGPGRQCCSDLPAELPVVSSRAPYDSDARASADFLAGAVAERFQTSGSRALLLECEGATRPEVRDKLRRLNGMGEASTIRCVFVLALEGEECSGGVWEAVREDEADVVPVNLGREGKGAVAEAVGEIRREALMC